MRNIHLHGTLKKYGETVRLDVDTAGEAVVALCANFPPEIAEDIREGSWHLMRGDPETGLALDEEMITGGLRLGDADLHIIPEVAGSKRGGILKAIVGGVALIAVSFGSAGFLAQPISNALIGGLKWGGNAIGRMGGLVMALSGVSQMLAPPEEETEDKEDSFLATGPPISTGGQGGAAVQIAYGGEVITGGMTISGGIDAHALEIGEDEPVTYPNPPFGVFDDQLNSA